MEILNIVSFGLVFYSAFILIPNLMEKFHPKTLG